MHDFPRTRRLLSLLPPPREVLRRAHPFLKARLRHIPFPLQQRIMESAINDSFRDALQAGELDFLQGRWLRIEIRDLGLRWHITRGSQGLVMINREMNADVSIRGQLRDFVALANQSEDPDTLFFQRRLSISGDTDMGLQLKNLIFATELEGLAGLLSRLLAMLLQYSPSRFAPAVMQVRPD